MNTTNSPESKAINELGELIRANSPELYSKGWAWLSDFLNKTLSTSKEAWREEIVAKLENLKKPEIDDSLNADDDPNYEAIDIRAENNALDSAISLIKNTQ